MNILVCGDGVTPTGFSRVLHSIVKYLPKEDYNIHWIAVNYYGDPHDYPYKIYPATLSNRADLYGFSRLPEFVDKNIDIIFILNDAWLVSVYLEYIKKFFKDKLPKIVVYTPVDAIDHDPDWYKDYDIVTRCVTYTEFGQQEIKFATKGSVNPLIIGHGTDSKDFYTLPISKKELRESYYPTRPDIYDDSFIILNANRNQPRKKVELSLRAFALFAENKPENVKFYYHGGYIDAGVDIIKLSARYGLNKGNRLILTSLIQGVQKVPTRVLNDIYNMCDIGVNTSLGEGWGLVSVEHAVTGAAQIVPMHSACRELFHDCGIMIKPTIPIVFETANTTGYMCTAEDIAKGYELLYTDRGLLKSVGQKAKDKFTSPKYSWENISKQWDELFKEVV